MKKLLLIIVLVIADVQADVVDSTTITNKIMCGYQGWFTTPNDDNPFDHWYHWSTDGSMPDGSNLAVDMYPDLTEFDPEDFYSDDDMVITISHMGYIKRTPLADFKSQNRGGKGSKGSATRDEDFIEYMFTATMHNTMLLFTEKGKVFWLKVYEIPEGTKTTKGRAIQNMLNIESDDTVKAFINLTGKLTDEEYINNNFK